MKYRFGLLVCLAVVLALSGCAPSPAPDAHWPDIIEIDPDIQLTRLAGGVWLHTSYHNYPGVGRYPANGLLVIDGRQLALIDTPATDSQTARLLDWFERNADARLKWVIPTHFHVDCMGGLAETHRRGARSWAHNLTRRIARDKNLPQPQNGFDTTQSLLCGSTRLELYYPGPGHAHDNMVVWLDQSKILFGGCLIKAAGSRSLGNTEDADTDAWPASVQNLIDRYPAVKTVIPGHGQPGDATLLTHTLSLFE